MKVYFSNYRDHWISPYTILEKVFFWREIDYDEPLIDRLSGILLPFCKALQKIRNFIYPQIKYVKIDRWDTWNMDGTLAVIILPLLKQLRAEKHGSGFVDLDDVPEGMRYTNTEDYYDQKTFDFYHEPDLQKIQCDIHDRWDWVLDEMIFAFEKITDDNWENEFWSKDNRKCDWDGRKKVQDRINNGLCLFGKYYQNLWD